MSRHDSPSDNEKNACPMAPTATRGVTLAKSGLNRNFTPSCPPGSSSELMQKAISNTASAGMSMLHSRSMPRLRPRRSTTKLANRNSSVHSTLRHGLATNCPNMALYCCGVWPLMWPPIASMRYSTIQPHTTL